MMVGLNLNLKNIIQNFNFKNLIFYPLNIVRADPELDEGVLVEKGPGSDGDDSSQSDGRE